jgi:hypothetical protein
MDRLEDKVAVDLLAVAVAKLHTLLVAVAVAQVAEDCMVVA